MIVMIIAVELRARLLTEAGTRTTSLRGERARSLFTNSDENGISLNLVPCG
jgi:hypothetical protein